MRKILALLVGALTVFALLPASAAYADSWGGTSTNNCAEHQVVASFAMERHENGGSADTIDFNGQPGIDGTVSGNGIITHARLQVRKVTTDNEDVLVAENFTYVPGDGGYFGFNVLQEISVERHPYLKGTAYYQNGDTCSVTLSWHHNWD